MAEKHACTPDDVKHVLYERPHSPRGYKKEYLSQNLTEMEKQLIICAICEGIMRDASTNEGEITCDLCCTKRFDAKPVKQVRSLVAKLSIKCPLLRDCEWTGQLSEAEEHFGICGSTLVLCPLGCESVVKRRETDQHTGNECQLRKVNCNFCGSTFQSVFLMDHVGICPFQPIDCDCGIEIPRSKMDMHIETECPFGEVECPYAKYSCKIGNMPRKDLLTHKKEFYIEHQDMLEEETSKLMEALKTKKDLTEVDFLVNLKGNHKSRKEPEYINGNTRFRFRLLSVDPIVIRIQSDSPPIRIPNFNILECRLILDKLSKTKESYFEVMNLNFKGGRENTIKLEKENYSQYVRKDGNLLIRMFFDIKM